MKLTVSNTSMMKPIFSVDSNQYRVAPPARIVGLLSYCSSAIRRAHAPVKLVQYDRPELRHALLQTAKWQDFLQLHNTQPTACVAVFGFEFDGINTWYQLWNNRTERSCWLLHIDSMSYAPYSILAMDALVSLLPHWDGALYQSPINSESPTPTCTNTTDLNDTNRTRNLMVFDASIGSTGHLWFLVTMNTFYAQPGMEFRAASSLSGWISQKYTRKLGGQQPCEGELN